MKIAVPSVGHCIYCGLRENLSREHVMPRGLGGNWAPDLHSDALVLGRASCESCRRITSSIETMCQRLMLEPARARLGMKRTDRAPTTAEGEVDFEDGRKESRRVPIESIPGAIVIPSFYEASALRFSAPPERSAPPELKMLVTVPGKLGLVPGARRIGVKLRFEPLPFARMLAKIALGFAVAKIGLKAFKPLVQDFILGREEDYGHWVGGFAGTPHQPEATDCLHVVHLRTHEAVTGRFVIVQICLFAEFRGPVNYVVVGRSLAG